MNLGYVLRKRMMLSGDGEKVSRLGTFLFSMRRELLTSFMNKILMSCLTIARNKNFLILMRFCNRIFIVVFSEEIVVFHTIHLIHSSAQFERPEWLQYRALWLRSIP